MKRGIHNIHDKSYKDLYSKKEIALDLFKNLIDVDWVKTLKVEDITLINKSFVTSDYEDTECDIVYKVNIGDKEVIFYILLEFQSTIDYRMPLRLLFYMCEILRDNAKNARHKRYNSKLKIPAVVPIVLYNGEQVWDVPNEFRKVIYNENLFGNGLLNFKYDVFDINNSFTKEELINNKNVTSAIFLLDQKIDAIEFLERIKTIALFFDALSDTEMIAIKHWIRNTVEDKLVESAINILECDKEDVELMVSNNIFLLTEMKEKAMKDGFEKGIEQGIEQGVERGIEKGIEKGIKKGIEKGVETGLIIAAKKLLNTLDDETIAKTLELDLDIVRKLRLENIKQ